MTSDRRQTDDGDLRGRNVRMRMDVEIHVRLLRGVQEMPWCLIENCQRTGKRSIFQVSLLDACVACRVHNLPSPRVSCPDEVLCPESVCD
jgi:hypothetical protein